MNELSKGLKISSAMTFVVILVGSYQVVSAQEVHGGNSQPAPSFVDTEQAIPAVAAKGHVLIKTYFHTNNFGASVPSSVYTPIDSKTTVSCPKGPCTIFAHMLAENGLGSGVDNYSTLLLYVDGVPADDSWLVGVAPSDGGWINVTQDTQINNLATGSHTVQMFYKSEFGATVNHYAVSYALYEP
jgi:hypothetical protein